MIFKDHVQWPSNRHVTDEEKKRGVLSDLEEYALLEKELEEKIGHRWPVRIKWHPSRITRIEDKEAPGGVRLERPPFYPVSLSWVAKGIGKDNRKHTWTYCDDYIPNALDKQLNQYMPVTKDLSGDDMFTKDNAEFVMWMFLAFPNIEGGKGATSSRNFLTFDLPHLENKKADKYNSLLSQVTLIINHPEYGKPIDELKVMLTSYFVPGVDKMEDYEVRAELKRKATEGATQEKQMESMESFLMQENNPEKTKVKFLCQKGIEAGLIEYISPRKLWVSMAGGKEDKVICKVQPEQINEKNQHLYETMAARINPDNRELLQMLELRFMGKAKVKAKEESEELPEESEDVIEDVIEDVQDDEQSEKKEKAPQKKGNPNWGKKSK